MAKRSKRKNRSIRKKLQRHEALVKEKERMREEELDKGVRSLFIVCTAYAAFMLMLAIAGVLPDIGILVVAAIGFVIMGLICIWGYTRHEVSQAKPLAVDLFICASLMIAACVIISLTAN